MPARSFEDRPAVREATPLLIGLIGPSGTGKTFSALRLATGIQRINGGDIFVIDTESRRSLHYAEKFKFRHVPFGAPFSSLDYLAAIDYCVGKGARTIIVDSMSHEHEGPGGVLEEHTLETKRLAALWKVKESVAQLSAWAEPKQKRRRMINSILQMNVNFIFSFRAKEKLKIVKGEDPEPMGFMPIAGEEFVYEMTLKCLLLPGANGVPTWSSGYRGEQMMMKLPDQFRSLFDKGPQLTEDLGADMARWAAGVAAKPVVVAAELLSRYQVCSDAATLRALEDDRKASWSTYSKEEREKVKAGVDAAKKRLEEAAAAPPPPDTNGHANAPQREMGDEV